MAKLYAVTEGAYSDYGIVALFSSKEKAIELYIERTQLNKKWHDPVYLEEYEDGGGEDSAELDLYNVVFDSHGNVEKADTDEPREEEIYVFIDGRASVYVFAQDKESAVKIAAEKRAVYLAQQNGI